MGGGTLRGNMFSGLIAIGFALYDKQCCMPFLEVCKVSKL